MNTVIIGGGNMGRSLLGGLLKAGVSPAQLAVVEPNIKTRQALAAFAIAVHAEPGEAAQNAQTVVLAVKPGLILGLAETLAPLLRPNTLVVSIAAGITVPALERRLGQLPVVRAMPNTPALVGAGMSVLFAGTHVGPPERSRAQAILDAVGRVAWVDPETLLDAVTAVSGSGPAYFFLVMEAMERAAVTLGLDAGLARILVQQTALGAAQMAALGDPGVLRAQVTSPGGTTERALATLETHGLSGAFQAALSAAALRARELAETYH